MNIFRKSFWIWLAFSICVAFIFHFAIKVHPAWSILVFLIGEAILAFGDHFFERNKKKANKQVNGEGAK